MKQILKSRVFSAITDKFYVLYFLFLLRKITIVHLNSGETDTNQVRMIDKCGQEEIF